LDRRIMCVIFINHRSQQSSSHWACV